MGGGGVNAGMRKSEGWQEEDSRLVGGGVKARRMKSEGLQGKG